MPKTKEQKRKEANERNRALFSKRRDCYMRWQSGGEYFEDAVMTVGRDRASLEASSQRINFEKWCKSVGLDTHGNVIGK